ncbi:MAG TPA: helix-turn-helix domain-containing protein [Acidimicrobiales bacterium]|jgi:DNA-binding HxlR family transcriptional regulator|nr:helix-turn-helix domain-containing protein [Acidimicrobiales bacterium]
MADGVTSQATIPAGDDHAGDDSLSGFCPRYHRAIEIVGRRWTGAIIRALLAGDVRFSKIRTTVPGLSDRLLSERLKELEAEGIVERQVHAVTPVRIEYHLTAKGEALGSVVQAVSEWAEAWLAADPAEPAEPAERAG